MYEELRKKYFVMLATWEYLKGILEIKIKDLQDEKKQSDREKEIKEIKNHFKISNYEKKLYIEYVENEIDTPRIREYFENFEDELEKGFDRLIYLESVEASKGDNINKYRRAIKDIELLKRIFYKSYGFNEKYNNGVWTNSYDKVTSFMIGFFERVFTFEINFDEDGAACIHDDVLYVIHEFADTYYIFDEQRDLNRSKKTIKQKREYLYAKETLNEILEFWNSEESDEVESSIVGICKNIAKTSRSEVEAFALIDPTNKLFAIYKENVEKIEKLIQQYTISNNKKDLLEEMKKYVEDIVTNKKESMIEIQRYFERKENAVDINYYKHIDRELYRELFSKLKKEIKNIFSDNDNIEPDIINRNLIVKENRNGIYFYGDKLIITLTFPNTDIDEYKTAVIITDSDKVNWAYKNSSNAAWTFKNGRTDDKYEIKTYKPDKITINDGKIEFAKMIYGDSAEDKKAFYYSNSHKFDFRKEHIIKQTSYRRKWGEEYYQGKIRFDDNSVEESICRNNEENLNDASILYFDDMEKFRDFLDNM